MKGEGRRLPTVFLVQSRAEVEVGTNGRLLKWAAKIEMNKMMFYNFVTGKFY